MEPESQPLKWGSGWGVSYRAPKDAPWEVSLGAGGTRPRNPHCPPALGGREDKGAEQ